MFFGECLFSLEFVFLVCVLVYPMDDEGESSYLFEPVSGFYGASMALLVGLKQLNPEKEWKYFKCSVRAKHLPFIFLLLSVILSVLVRYYSEKSGNGSFVLGIFGMITGWTYLRFFQFKDGVKGDQSVQFKFSSLFPELLQPRVEFLVNLFCICFICFQKKKQTPLAEADTIKYSVLDSPEDAERRRQLAIKVLDASFQNMKELPLPKSLADSSQETKYQESDPQAKK